VGVLTRADLLTGLARHGQLATVGDVMQRKFCTAESAEMVESVWSRLQDDACRTMPVVQNGKLIGILTSENLGEYFMIQAALDESQRGQRPNGGRTARRREPRSE
jgi:CBS-domain-containing membrane protein